jgi:hypothetical protein
MFMYILVDTLQSYTASIRQGRFRRLEHDKVPIGWADYSLFYQFFFVWIYIAITYSTMELLNAFFGVAAVLFGFANPRDCPSSFGDIKETYTVRKAWS